jgi:hypothetical protein
MTPLLGLSRSSPGPAPATPDHPHFGSTRGAVGELTLGGGTDACDFALLWIP